MLVSRSQTDEMLVSVFPYTMFQGTRISRQASNVISWLTPEITRRKVVLLGDMVGEREGREGHSCGDGLVERQGKEGPDTIRSTDEG